jgi:hypothetical protein
MKTLVCFALSLSCFSLARAEEPAPPPAEDPPPAENPPPTVESAAPKKDRGEVMVGVKVGGLFAEPFSRLGASYLVDLEIGYALPVLKHRLAITLEGAFTDPQADGKSTDPRLDASMGGSYSWHLDQRELILGLSLVYRHKIGRFTPYVGVGPRLFLLESKVSGTAGSAKISVSDEVSTKVGAGIPLGLGIRLGPGDLFVEFAINVSSIDHRATGDSNTGSLSLAAGYRVIF